jgi:hypothetical protein
MGEIASACRIFRWEDNIKTDVRKIGWKGVDWIHLAQDTDGWPTLVETMMDFWVP